MDHIAILVVEGPRYRLRDGSMGTEYQALREVLRILEARQRYLDEQIELVRLRMQTAWGAPP